MKRRKEEWKEKKGGIWRLARRRKKEKSLRVICVFPPPLRNKTRVSSFPFFPPLPIRILAQRGGGGGEKRGSYRCSLHQFARYFIKPYITAKKLSFSLLKSSTSHQTLSLRFRTKYLLPFNSPPLSQGGTGTGTKEQKSTRGGKIV